MNQALLRQGNRSNTPMEVRWNSAGAVQVSLHYTRGSLVPDLDALKSLGATDILQSSALSLVQAWVPADELRNAAALPGVSRVTLPRYAYHKGTVTTGRRTYTGSVDTQGDQLLGAASFRNQTGITGQGITVGVISDGDTHISTSQASGDLPSNIWNDPNDSGSFKSTGDEGTAMMEIVYDLAPGVKQLGFCGPQTEADFITCLDDFKSNISTNVIVDDLGFQGGAMFSDDDFNTAVQSFASANPNIRLVTSAGNDATGYWQGSWRASTVITSVNGVNYTQALNFSANATPVTYLTIDTSQASSGDVLGYQVEWNDPWTDNLSGPNDQNDYDVVVFDNPNASSSGGAGNTAVACNQGLNSSSPGPTAPTSSTICNQQNKQSTTTPGPQPIQGSAWVVNNRGQPYYLEVFPNGGSPGPNIKVLVFDLTNPVPISVTPSTSGSVFGHAALPYPAEITTSAFDAQQPLYTIEPFSSTGPVEYGVTGGTAQSIPKPDFTGPDDVSVTGAGGFENPFFGTSAAAPHIAGLVALLMSGYPGQSPYTLLQDAATEPTGNPSPNGTFGYGVPIMTNLLGAGMYPTPTASISSPANNATTTTGQPLAFTGTCNAHGFQGKTSVDWNFGSSGVPDSTQANPSVTFNNAGTYAVTLKCSDSSGAGSASVNVTANAPSKGGALDLFSLVALVSFAAWRRRRVSAA